MNAHQNREAGEDRRFTIPSGQVSVTAAAAFMVALCLVGLAVLLQFNWYTVVLGISSLALVAIYPFMKRYTYWPQLVLGPRQPARDPEPDDEAAEQRGVGRVRRAAWNL